MPPEGKLRVDALLLAQGLAESRSQAQALIAEGKVWLGDEPVQKASRTLPADAALRVEAPPRFVGRGGEKLEAFMEAFPVAVEGLTFLDVGASTGGFTDCLLQRGAARAICVDVGHGQLHPRLLADPRVTNLEGINARHLQPDDLPLPRFPLIVMDLSFISLRKVLPNLWPLLAPGGHLIALVKPQFEAEKSEVARAKGIIRDDAIRTRILQSLQDFARTQLPDCHILGSLECPIHGGDGNREYLLGLTRRPLQTEE
ncbi:MAG: TlyA family RNA methyltransferase [Verrucomicrobiota bacterium]